MWWIFLLLPLLGFAEAASVGQCVALEGVVFAIGPDNLERPLELLSPVFEKDTIKVEENSRTQLKFTDGSIATLPPSTRFAISEYQYRKIGQKDRFSSELLEGGIQLLSGSIGKKNPKEYNIKTPNATLGLRGTLIEARIISGQVYFSVQQGKAVIANNGGTIFIGAGELTQFSTVTSLNNAPEFVFSRPRELEPELFIPPAGGVILQPPTTLTPAPTVPQTPTAPSETAPTQDGESRSKKASIQRGC